MHNALRTLDFNLLKTLDALLDERSVTRAAQRLSLTQPAVSAMLNRLRDNFADPLFTRDQYGMTPTLRALALAAPVKQILSDIDRLLQPVAFDPRQAKMRLTLAATDYALTAVAVPFAVALRHQAPGISVSLQGVGNGELSVHMARGEIDVALLTPDTTPPDLHAAPLFDEQYVCLLRADHPAIQQGRITLDTFCQLDHALVSHSGQEFSGVTDRALAAAGRQRRVVMAINSFLLLPQLLRSSDLIAVVPRRLALTAPDLATVTPPLPIEGFSKTLVWHERSHRDPAHRWLREQLLRTASLATAPS